MQYAYIIPKISHYEFPALGAIILFSSMSVRDNIILFEVVYLNHPPNHQLPHFLL